MAKIINLRNARKQRARQEKSQLSAENRVRFGRTKGQKNRDTGEAERKTLAHDGHKLTDNRETDG